LCVDVSESQVNRLDSATATQSNAKATGSGAETDAQTQPESAKDLELRITALKSVVVVGQTLRLRVEFWNNGATPLFICKDFLTSSAVACGLTLSFTPHGTGPGSGLAGDCFPGGQKFNFAKELAQHWILLSPKSFYGTEVLLHPSSNNHELEQPGNYHLSGQYFAYGLLSKFNCDTVALFPDEVALLPWKSWMGVLNSNVVAIRVVAKK